MGILIFLRSFIVLASFGLISEGKMKRIIDRSISSILLRSLGSSFIYIILIKIMDISYMKMGLTITQLTNKFVFFFVFFSSFLLLLIVAKVLAVN
jgi:hypothetical protein